MNVRYQVLLLELARHAGSYVELGAAAAGDYRRSWKRRVGLLLTGLVTSIAAILAVWAAGLVAFWDTPWRLAYVAVTAVALAALATYLLYAAVADPPLGPSAGKLRDELHKDRELFQQWKSTL